MERRLFYTLFFVFGIVLPHLSWPNLTGLTSTLVIIVVWRPPLRTVLVIATAFAALFLGIARSQWDLRAEEPTLPNHKVEAEGIILEPPRRWGKSSVFFFQIERIEQKRVRPIKVMVRWSGCEQTLEVGDRWSLVGRPSPGEPPQLPGGFDQRHWLWSQRAVGVLHLHRHSGFHFIGPPNGFTPHQLSYRARAWMMQRLRLMENERARSLVAGVVFGETQSLPPDLQEQFRRTGTSHLLAASGMNVALLAGIIIFAGRLFGLGAWRVAPLAIPAVIAYAFLAGCSPSITRAATGATLALTALSIGRTSNAWNTLCLSIWALLLWDPRTFFDLGFQLSVVAVIGLVSGPKAPQGCGFVGRSLLLTISASLATLPIFWWSFGELSTTLLLANLLLGPIVELLFPLGLLMTLVPIKPLLFACDRVACLSLWMVAWLSDLADPLSLCKPEWPSCLLILTALALWWRGRHWLHRSLAGPAVFLAVWLCLQSGQQPSCLPGELLVRKIGKEPAVYWVSTNSREVLVLDEPWQEKRARDLVRQSGCLKNPEIRVLNGSPLRFRWGEFEWKEVAPYLPSCSYLEVKVTRGEYYLRFWVP